MSEQTQTGFGNALSSEAVEGALPPRQNTPLQPPFGLYPEQINGTGFTVQRALNRRVWLYRLRPVIPSAPWVEHRLPWLAGDFRDGVPTPALGRYAPLPPPEEPTHLIDSLVTFAGAGSAELRAGLAIHLYAANADMVDTVYSNADGDHLLVPYEGRVRVRSELGVLTIAPGQIAVLPRGIRYQFTLPDGASRGFLSELFNGPHRLPERGLIGANGLADERHFHAPVAAFEDREGPITSLHRLGGRLWKTTLTHSPFDVVAWHGNLAPFRYDLMDFAPHWSVLHDHPDPSVLTVLTAPHDSHGQNALDFACFRGRWDPTEHTFRPPYLHRNAAIEFNAVIQTPRTSGPYTAGAYSFTPTLTPHGVPPASYRAEAARAKPGKDLPLRRSDDELWVQWESCYVLKRTPWMVGHATEDRGFSEQFRDYPPARLP